MVPKKPSERVSTVKMMEELIPALDARLNIGAEKYGDTDWMGRPYLPLWSLIALDLKEAKATMFKALAGTATAAEIELAATQILDIINRLAMIRAKMIQIQGVFHA